LNTRVHGRTGLHHDLGALRRSVVDDQNLVLRAVSLLMAEVIEQQR
jgi:hypothetical protein